MIFTIGRKDIYEELFGSEQVPKKAIGGSVWEHYIDAFDYLRDTNQRDGFGIYAVDADWRTDTEAGEGFWRALTCDARLYKVMR